MRAKKYHIKNNRYYQITAIGSRRKWVALSLVKDGEDALQRAVAMVRNDALPKVVKRLRAAKGTDYKKTLTKYLRKCFTTAQSRARQFDFECSITFDQIIGIAEKFNWRCQLTGLPFELAPVSNGKYMPFAPSIDRIDSQGGYCIGNVRIICLAMNYSLNEWGESVFATIAKNYLNHSQYLPCNSGPKNQSSETSWANEFRASFTPPQRAIFSPMR